MSIKMISGDHVPVKLRQDHDSYSIVIGDRVNVAETNATGWVVREADGTADYECGCGIKVSGPKPEVMALAKLHMLQIWEPA